ncbi:MAG: cytochrome c5 family protein [Gammaproteobacteria bacterium]|nr:cytochrome c5 family protein [Gammaproteobacteria bacterium]
MTTQKSGKFFFGSIVTFLIVALVIKVILVNVQDVSKNVVAPESMTEEAIQERIKPVAEVYVGEAPVVEVAAAEETAADSSSVGEKIVSQVCAMCHASGMMNSPKLGSASDWAPRIEKGVDTLYANAINGLNMMPARGGRPDLSDDDVKAAVDHMLELAK